MKNLLVLFLAILFLTSCGMTDMQPDQEISDGILALRGPVPKISVCKYDAEIDDWVVINVNANALPALEAQGAVQLIDEDGDGYVTMENTCGIPVDCDDTDSQLTDNCNACHGIEIDFNGPLYVAEADEPGTYSWQGAIDQCAAKALADGCGWYMPNTDELYALYLNRDVIGGFDVTGRFPDSFYWSSSEFNDVVGYWRHFGSYGGQYQNAKTTWNISCRCVRK